MGVPRPDSGRRSHCYRTVAAAANHTVATRDASAALLPPVERIPRIAGPPAALGPRYRRRSFHVAFVRTNRDHISAKRDPPTLVVVARRRRAPLADPVAAPFAEQPDGASTAVDSRA